MLAHVILGICACWWGFQPRIPTSFPLAAAGAAAGCVWGRAPRYTANFSLPKTLPKRLPQEAPRRSPKGAQEACLFNSQMPESFWHLKIEGSNSQMPESFWHLRIKGGTWPLSRQLQPAQSASPAQPSPASQPASKQASQPASIQVEGVGGRGGSL